jgi:hypothetical protein
MPPALSRAQPPCDWAAVRSAYETTTDSVAAIAARFQLADIQIHGVVHRQGWLRPASPPTADGTPPLQTPPALEPTGPQSAKPARPKTLKPRRQGMIDRLYRVIDNNLSQLEDIMRNQSDPSIADNEKETRTIGTVIGNIEKLKGLEDDAGKSNGRASKSVAPADTAAETERLGRELAERLSRLAKDLRA